MPIYEYQCTQCSHRLESFERMTDAPLTDCPACGESSLQKLVSAAGFQLKGTGWYATDFRNNTGTVENKSENKSEDKSEVKPEVKSNTDSKTTDTTAS
ncbi:MAG: regulatory protein [Gammaproteobacteria bacterium]|jgi:putative FmdB family regulatory protein|nr:regulatory protein [Gammaproteobacteria bacterium]MCE3237151.1 regulatory protein [Gammaproteobacteria bacterium]